MNFPTRNVTPLSPSPELMLGGEDGQLHNIQTSTSEYNSVYDIISSSTNPKSFWNRKNLLPVRL